MKDLAMKTPLICHLSSENSSVLAIKRDLNVMILRHFLIHYEKWHKLCPKLLELFDEIFKVENASKYRAEKKNDIMEEY